jgi:phosphomannomutase
MELPFKAYDIRGVYGETLTDSLVEDIGKALAHHLDHGTIIVGFDARDSSPDLRDALISGLKSHGSDVIDIRQCTSPELYWAVNDLDADGGVMITASHNPPEYNGLKLCGANAEPIDEATGLQTIYDLTQDLSEEPVEQGSYNHVNTRDDYLAFLTSLINPDELTDHHIVFDAGNGVAGPTVQSLYDDLLITYDSLYLAPDSAFPNHDPNPMISENTEAIREHVKTSDAEAGFAWDGDGDRFFLIDETGAFVAPDVLYAFIADRYLAGNHGPLVKSALCGRIVDDVANRHDVSLGVSRVGHGFVKRCVDEHNAVLGGEHSGHYYFDETYGCDDGIAASLITYAVINDLETPLSTALDEYRSYVKSGEQNFEVNDRDAALRRVEDAYSDHEIERIDGLTVHIDDTTWFNVRKSNSEPLVRLNVEGTNEATVQDVTADVKAIIDA